MILTIAILALAGMQDRLPWTWALYEGDTVVLAQEVPDTPRLSATFECATGSSIARLTLYGGRGGIPGPARVAAGDATVPAQLGDQPRALTLRTDHPVFAAFAAQGRLTVATGDAGTVIEVDASHIDKLRRFVALCSG